MKYTVEQLQKLYPKEVEELTKWALERMEEGATDKLNKFVAENPQLFFGSTGIPCSLCKKTHEEFSIPNEIWNVIIRQSGPETDREYLCFDCFIDKFTDYIQKS